MRNYQKEKADLSASPGTDGYTDAVRLNANIAGNWAGIRYQMDEVNRLVQQQIDDTINNGGYPKGERRFPITRFPILAKLEKPVLDYWAQHHSDWVVTPNYDLIIRVQQKRLSDDGVRQP